MLYQALSVLKDYNQSSPLPLLRKLAQNRVLLVSSIAVYPSPFHQKYFRFI